MVEINEVKDGADDLVADILAVLDAQSIEKGRPFVISDLHLRAADARGDFLGGLKALQMQGWLFVEYLGVHQSVRGKGIGRALLARVESIGRERGLAGVYLDTFSFQAPDFYLGNGYHEIGRLPAIADTPERIWFCKVFEETRT